MTNDEIRIRQLVSRFMAGETTIEEEDWLEEWFKGHPSASADLEPYRQAFLWMGRGMPLDEDGTPAIEGLRESNGNAGSGRRQTKIISLKTFVAVAASVAAVIVLSLTLFFQRGGQDAAAPQIAVNRQPAPVTRHDADSMANAEVRADSVAKPQPPKVRKPTRHHRYRPVPPLPMMDKPLIAISDSALREADHMAGIELARMEAQQDEGLRQYEMALSDVYDIMAGMYAEEESADDDAQDYDKSF